MSPTEAERTRKLTEAVNHLVEVVEGLDATLKSDYPKRSEIRRSRKYFISAVALALVLSYFATVNTVSYCFLGANPYANKEFCHIFPGYTQSLDRSRDVLGIFQEITDTTHANRARIEKLEKDLQDLKNGG